MNSYANIPQAAPTPQSPMDAAIGELSAALNRLESTAEHLASRLTPALMVEQSVGQTSNGAPIPTPAVPLLALLEQARQRIAHVSDQLENISFRLVL